MHNLRTRGLWDKQHFENLASVVDQTLSDQYYVKWFGTGNIHDDASTANHVTVTTFVDATSQKYPVIQMPDGVGTRVLIHRVKPQYWISGNIKFRLHWINDTASTNTFVLSHIVQKVTAGAVASAIAAANTQSVAGINVADAYMITDLGTWWRVTNEIDALTLRLTRLGADASDTNTDSFNLVGIEMIYKPVERMVGVSG